jgi:hypothetical protein
MRSAATRHDSRAMSAGGAGMTRFVMDVAAPLRL